MNACYYDCVNGRLILLTGNCAKPCPPDGGACNQTNGQIIVVDCPIEP